MVHDCGSGEYFFAGKAFTGVIKQGVFVHVASYIMHLQRLGLLESEGALGMHTCQQCLRMLGDDVVRELGLGRERLRTQLTRLFQGDGDYVRSHVVFAERGERRASRYVIHDGVESEQFPARKAHTCFVWSFEVQEICFQMAPNEVRFLCGGVFEFQGAQRICAFQRSF